MKYSKKRIQKIQKKSKQKNLRNKNRRNTKNVRNRRRVNKSIKYGGMFQNEDGGMNPNEDRLSDDMARVRSVIDDSIAILVRTDQGDIEIDVKGPDNIWDN